MITISLCMIVKNEENTLERCLNTVIGLVDEINIVDTGSHDKTKEIARKFSARIYDFPWIDDFAAARNFSFSQASKEYILWLDADDIILKEDFLKFKKLKEQLNPAIDAVMMKYNTGFDEFGNITMSYFRGRLVKRSANFRWKEPVHEYLDIRGNIINADCAITHKRVHTASSRNMEIYQNILRNGKELTPRGLYYYARELYYNGLYDEAISYLNKFLDSEKGWVEDNINACSMLNECFKLKEDKENSLNALFKSFKYDTPRAEICCQLGYHYKEKEDFTKAIFWFELASQLKKDPNNWGFTEPDCWSYIPYIELCVCYYRLGNIEKAIICNNKAAEYKPNAAPVLYNKEFFENLILSQAT